MRRSAGAAATAAPNRRARAPRPSPPRSRKKSAHTPPGRPTRLRRPRVRVGPLKLTGFNPLATQRGDGLRAPRRSARLDPGLALNEAAGAIAEPEEEDLQAMRNAALGSGITRPTARASPSQPAI